MNKYDEVVGIISRIKPIETTSAGLPYAYAKILSPLSGRSMSFLAAIAVIVGGVLLIPVMFFWTGFYAKNKTQKKKMPKPFLVYSIVDSLEHYAANNILYHRPGLTFFSGKKNGLEFGIYSDTSMKVQIIFKINDVWKVVDQVELPLISLDNVECSDLNNDSMCDLRVDGSYSEESSDSRSVVLLYKPNFGRFIVAPQLSYPNIRWDNKSRSFHSDSWSYDSGKAAKEVLVQDKDVLAVKEGVSFLPDSLTDGAKAKVEFYSEENKKRIVTRSYYGEYEKMWKLFTKSLWVSE